jgi:5-methylcytosine-specific restriction endonuclease McrA
VKARNNQDYFNWRKTIFERDNFTCQICKIKGKFLHGHHIVGVYERFDLIYEVDNGITLCKDCHIDFHNKYGRKNFPNILLIINNNE